MAGLAALSAGVFGCADTALTGTSDARLRALASNARPRFADSLERIIRRRDTVQARYLSGRVIGQWVAVSSYTWYLTTIHEALRMKVTLALAGLLLIGGIMHAAAAVGRRLSDWMVEKGLWLLRPLELCVAPIAEVMRAFALRVPYFRRRDERQVTEHEVEIILDQGEKSGVIPKEPVNLIRNVLEFSELTARDAMVPRTKVTAIKLGTSIEKVVQIITETGHSRYPVYRDEIDDVFGLLYAKDIFSLLKSSWHPPAMEDNGENGDTPSRREARLMPIIREPIKVVSAAQSLSKLLQEMRRDRQHIAMVVDEFGSFSGIVTLEDVIEEIVGDIQDEHDSEEAPIVELAPGRLIADAAVYLSELSAYLGYELDPEGQYDSLGGMLTDKLGTVPEVGTSIRAYGMRFIVRESDAKHIAKVEIVRGRADTSGPHSVA